MATISQILSAGIQDTSQETINWDILQQSANIFLSTVKLCQNNIIFAEQNKKLEKQRAAQKFTIAKTQDWNSQLLNNRRDMYDAVFQFDAILTQYLNELPKQGVYVNINAKTKKISTFVVPLPTLAKLIDYEGKVVRGPNAIATEKQKTIESQLEQNSDDKIHADKGGAVVKEVLTRLDNFYKKFNAVKKNKKYYVKKSENEIEEKSLSTQRQGGLLMWKNSGKWRIALVANAGVVSEAYVNFLFARHQTQEDKLCGIDDKERLIDLFYDNYMAQVTNLAASIEEDVVVKGIGQFAVKAKKAELPNVQQYIDIANKIINSTSALNKDSIMNTINSDTSSSKLAPLLRENISPEDIKNMLDAYQNKDNSTTKISKLNPKSTMKGFSGIVGEVKYDAIDMDELLVEAAYDYIQENI